MQKRAEMEKKVENAFKKNAFQVENSCKKKAKKNKAH